MNLRTSPRAPLAFAILIACSGADPTTPASTGGAPVAPVSPAAPASPGASGLGFDVKSAIHGIGSAGTTIIVSDAPDLCATLSQQDACGMQPALGAGFLRLSAAGAPPGTFTATAVLVGPGQVAASTGAARVVLDAESPDGLLSGSYDLGPAGVAGQFTTRRCAALDARAGDASSSTSQSCSVSTQVVNDRSEYDERCTCHGRTTSRQCTLGAGESTWSCVCNAASGTRSTCESQAAQPGVEAPPPNCCPGG